MGVVTVICSGKGGVGKSTVSVGLGRALSIKGRNVLLIDCDAGLRTLDKMTGIEKELLFDISDVTDGNCAPINAIYHVKNTNGLHVLPAPMSITGMPVPKVMAKLVTMLKKYYDHVIIDSPAGIGNGFKTAAISADKALIISNPDPVCVRSTERVGELIGEMGIKNKRLIINKFNEVLFNKIDVAKDLDGIVDDTGVRLLGVIPEDYELAARFLKGKSVSKTSDSMLSFMRIAARFEGESVPLLIK